MHPGSPVRLTPHASRLPSTLIPYAGMAGRLIAWETVRSDKAQPRCVVEFQAPRLTAVRGIAAVVNIEPVRLIVAAGHLELELELELEKRAD